MDAERKQELLKQLENDVAEMEEDSVSDAAKAYLAEGFDAYEGIVDGLCAGMEKAGKLYEQGEYFVPELLACSDAMYAGMDILRPALKTEQTAKKAAVVIGVVEGDTHDIGKNLVKAMLETTGCQVYDLGRDVPARSFVEKALEVGAKFIGLSTLMTTTMPQMKSVIDLLKEAGVRENVKVLIGGGPVSEQYAREIGADRYTPNAAEAAAYIKQLLA